MPHAFRLFGPQRFFFLRIALLTAALLTAALPAQAADRLTLTVEQPVPGAPLTVGLPFPKGALASPDHVRLLTEGGQEIPSQVTEVTSWAPADSSVKWIWVFFFAEDTDRYVLEYGPDVRRAPITGDRIQFVNSQRAYGFAEITTGPLRLRIDKGGNGFLDAVFLDTARDGFDEEDLIARGPSGGRGSFLDLLDDAGVDSSHAVITQTFKEKGSGPLHAILRVEGEYRYGRDDNNTSPFILRIHAYAGTSYVRVLHTLTYTGDPDQHPPLTGQHALIATQADRIVDERTLEGDTSWTQPNDRIAAAGLALRYQLAGDLTAVTALREGAWWESGAAVLSEHTVAAGERWAVQQAGPDLSGPPPGPSATPTERIEGFEVTVTSGGEVQQQATRAAGWMDVRGAERGIGIGLRHFVEEYPNALSLDAADTLATASLWPAEAAPMDFSRTNSEEDGGMVDNFAQGLTKTTELVYHFHTADERRETVARTLGYVLDPPVAHAALSWYAQSRVYGFMAPASERFPEYERGLSYKFDWWRYNQNWEPWYGMFAYGDGKTYFFQDDWYVWDNNEPATDYMWWMAFMRTGSRADYLTAEATSRHTMDVDNTHWPAGPDYRGDSNAALDYWKAAQAPADTPYLGMGRRHAQQQWTALLSAHVWVPGWMASYYLSGYHRGLEVAKQTGDYYRRRTFGEHGLTGRRLYLSVWNLAEIWDATKSEAYRAELEDRVDRMLGFQEEQAGSLVMDRYGYAQVYASHGLGKVHRMTGDADVRRALVKHARAVRDMPPLNHEMESYLSSIHSLLTGYRFTGESGFYQEALRRAQVLKTDALPGTDPFRPARAQGDLAEALEAVSHLPESRAPRPALWKITNGLRVFGWTHAYNVPYLLYWLEKEGRPEAATLTPPRPSGP